MCNRQNGPGKFEGEPCYAEDVYIAALDGATEIIDTPEGAVIDVFEVDDEFRQAHDIAANVFAIIGEESEQGFYSTREVTKPELDTLRVEIEDDYDDEPQEEDYYLSDDERSVLYCGKCIAGPVSSDAEPCPQDAVMRELAAVVARDGYAPNVWKYSDHGNTILISVQDCGCYFTEHIGKMHPAGTERGEATS